MSVYCFEAIETFLFLFFLFCILDWDIARVDICHGSVKIVRWTFGRGKIEYISDSIDMCHVLLL